MLCTLQPVEALALVNPLDRCSLSEAFRAVSNPIGNWLSLRRALLACSPRVSVKLAARKLNEVPVLGPNESLAPLLIIHGSGPLPLGGPVSGSVPLT